MKHILNLNHGCTAPMAWNAPVRGQNLSNDSIFASTQPRFGYQPEGKTASKHSEGWDF
ncbi:hypothetical protein G3A43_09025 [Paraburkholderia aspalathi]|nr:hypothetical protein [Paraburkholderia aspalathi]MBK3780401.1 hypothetical protein [Paraburkholderia aspalathi]